jgi:hypothetical protein
LKIRPHPIAAPLPLLGMDASGRLACPFHLGSFKLTISVRIELLEQPGLELVVSTADQTPPALGAPCLHGGRLFLLIQRAVSVRVELAQHGGFEVPFTAPSLATRFLRGTGLIELLTGQFAVAIGVELRQNFFPSRAFPPLGLVLFSVFFGTAFGHCGLHCRPLLFAEFTVSIRIELRQHFGFHFRGRRAARRTTRLFSIDGSRTVTFDPLFSHYRTGQPPRTCQQSDAKRHHPTHGPVLNR